MPTRYGPMSWLRNDHYVGRSLDLYGEYSQSEADLLARILKPGDVVVEAGANVGGLTLPMAAAIAPYPCADGRNGKVLAFEPQPRYFELLHFNVLACRPKCSGGENEDHHPGAHIGNLALGAEERLISLRAIEEIRTHAPGWETGSPSFEAKQITVDSLNLERLDLVKIDVDGQEHEILKGADETIARCRPLIYVEYDKPEKYPDMLPWLIERGYRLYQHMAPLYSQNNFRGNKVNVFGGIVSAMILAVPSERKGMHPTEWGLSKLAVSISQ